MGKAKLKKIKYYDLRKNWRKVKRHLDNPRVASTLVRDFNKFAYGRWRRRFTASRYPCEFESCDWAVCHACKLGLEGIVSKRLGSPYRSGRSRHWIKSKNPKHSAVTREAEEDWG